MAATRPLPNFFTDSLSEDHQAPNKLVVCDARVWSPSLWEGRAKRGEGKVRLAFAQISSPSPACGRPSRREGEFAALATVLARTANLSKLA